MQESMDSYREMKVKDTSDQQPQEENKDEIQEMTAYEMVMAKIQTIYKLPLEVS